MILNYCFKTRSLILMAGLFIGIGLVPPALSESPVIVNPDGKLTFLHTPKIEESTEDQATDIGRLPRPSEPDPKTFEFIEFVPMLPDPNHDREVERYKRAILELTGEELDALIEEAARNARPEDDLAVLHTTDGRLYKEGAIVFKTYPLEPEDKDSTSRPPDSTMRKPQDSKDRAPYDSPKQKPYSMEHEGLNREFAIGSQWAETTDGHRLRHAQTKFIRTTGAPAHNHGLQHASLHLAKVFGGDGRRAQTSAAFPWRAVGVMLHPGNGIESCSGVMISPRLILTAAHCFTSNGKRVTHPLFARPAARGVGFSGDRTPFGNRQGIWFWWPDGWNGKATDIRYDYGVILLSDINWSPGFVSFGKRSATELNFKEYNTAGYPAREFDCDDSPLGEDESCGGYMYRQHEEVRSVLDGRMYHKFDMEDGQSGSPIYEFDSDTDRRVVVGIHTYSYHISNIATRIRSGVFSFLCRRIEEPNNQSSFFNDPFCD